MANVDEILKNIWAKANLPNGAIPHHVMVAIEYSVPSEGGPRRLVTLVDEDCPPWLVQGMCCHIQDGVVEDMFASDDDDP